MANLTSSPGSELRYSLVSGYGIAFNLPKSTSMSRAMESTEIGSYFETISSVSFIAFSLTKSASSQMTNTRFFRRCCSNIILTWSRVRAQRDRWETSIVRYIPLFVSADKSFDLRAITAFRRTVLSFSNRQFISLWTFWRVSNSGPFCSMK